MKQKKVVNLFLKNYGNIVYKRIKKCKNRSLLRNKGADIAKYEILCFLDNDILTPPDFIKRHWEEHQKINNLVLMQCRRSLTQFDITKLGEETLLNNFDLLEKLPWYRDERIDIYENKDQWRFVFSHTLSVRKDDFIKAGKYNKRFGEHWGFEDLELGFNLMKINCDFKLLTDYFTYHQPHFTQSNKEQNETRFNKDLFVSLHNCYEVELYSTFYTDYTLFLESIKSCKKIYKKIIISIKEKLKFDRILGCINSQNDRQLKSKYQLGTYIPLLDNSCKKILVLPTFFEFPELVQTSILSEAFRVSKKIFFHKVAKKEDNLIKIIAIKAGFDIKQYCEDEYYVYEYTNKRKSIYYALIIPEIYSPEKRFVYFWLCKVLIDNKKRIILSDLHNLKSFLCDDFRANEKDIEIINKLFTNYLGSVNYNLLVSLSVYNSQSQLKIPNINKTFLIHDDEYYLNINRFSTKKFNNCSHYTELQFAELTLSSVTEVFNENLLNNSKSTKDSYIVFMENGYFEDGIDICLEAFSEVVKKDNSAKLIIKLPNYEELFEKCLPWHNKESKNNKFFYIKQKYEKDMFILKNQLHLNGIEENTKIIKKNMSINEIKDLILDNENMFYFSRGCYVAPQVYIAIGMLKKVYLGEHHIIPEELKQFVVISPSEKLNFAEGLKVPISIINSVYSVFKVRYRLKDYTKHDLTLINEIYNNISKKVKKSFR